MKLTFSHYFALLMPSRQNGMTLLKRLQQLLFTTAGRKWDVLNVSNTSWPNNIGCKSKFKLIWWFFVNFGISTLCKKTFLNTPVIIVKKCGVQKILLAKKQEFYVVVSGLWHTCFTPISNTWKFQEKQNVWKSLKRSHFPDIFKRLSNSVSDAKIWHMSIFLP